MLVPWLLLVACSEPVDTSSPLPPTKLGFGAAETVLTDGELLLERQRWTLGAESGWAWRVRVPREGGARVVYTEAQKPLSELAPRDKGPWAAINGAPGEFDPMGLVVADGVERHALESRKNSGIFVTGEEGHRIVAEDAWSPGPTGALQSRERIVVDGASIVADRRDPHTARSAVALSGEHLWLVTLAADPAIDASNPLDVAVRRGGDSGMPIAVFAEYLRSTTNAEDALLLEGSNGTHLEVRAQGKRFSLSGEQGTLDGIVVRPEPPPLPKKKKGRP